MPEITIEVTKDQYEKAGSKFITFAKTDKLGTLYYKPIELGMPDWENVGQSLKFPVTIIGSDIDAGKTEKLVVGLAENAIWKFKEVQKALGFKVIYKKTAKGEMPSFNTDDIAGKKAIGCWELQEGNKGGDAAQGKTIYPKLVAFYPADYKPVK